MIYNSYTSSPHFLSNSNKNTHNYHYRKNHRVYSHRDDYNNDPENDYHFDCDEGHHPYNDNNDNHNTASEYREYNSRFHFRHSPHDNLFRAVKTSDFEITISFSN